MVSMAMTHEHDYTIGLRGDIPLCYTAPSDGLYRQVSNSRVRIQYEYTHACGLCICVCVDVSLSVGVSTHIYQRLAVPQATRSLLLCYLNPISTTRQHTLSTSTVDHTCLFV